MTILVKRSANKTEQKYNDDDANEASQCRKLEMILA